jgi:PAT family beta-lactamase induction signal transducer AmpG
VAGSRRLAAAYLFCAAFVLPAVVAGLWLGEPERHRDPTPLRGAGAVIDSVVAPLPSSFRRRGAWLVLLFVLLHKIGDTLANLTVRLLLDDLQFSNNEIATYDVGFGFFAYLIGIFVGGVLYARMGMKRSVLLSLVLMAVSNLSFAALAASATAMPCSRFTICFENFASGIGGVVVVAYLSALCNLTFTAHTVRAAVGGGVDRGPLRHRHHRRGADRRHGLCRLLPADHADRAAGHRAVRVDAARRPGGQRDRGTGRARGRGR